MAQAEHMRIDPKRRSGLHYKKKQFAEPVYKQQDYKQRLNFYSVPPTADITLEEFEEWAIHRLKGMIPGSHFGNCCLCSVLVLAELEACSFRNKSHEETVDYMRPILEKHMPLSQNSARSLVQQEERRKDHYSHFILRLAFSTTEDLRRRFTRLESQLFKLRFQDNDTRDRQEFVESLDFEWEKVSESERREFSAELMAVNPPMRKQEDDGWFKVDWEKVPELVESRRVFLRRGKAYVPAREQTSMVVSEFGRRLDQALEVSRSTRTECRKRFRLTPHSSLQHAPFPVSTKTTASPLSSRISPKISPPPAQPTTNLNNSPALPSLPHQSTPYPNISPSACATST